MVLPLYHKYIFVFSTPTNPIPTNHAQINFQATGIPEMNRS